MAHKSYRPSGPRVLSEILWVWGITAAVCMAAGYAIYIWLFLTAGVQPNATSWSLWALGGLIEAWSFRKVVRASQSAKENRERLSPLEIAPLVCAIAAMIVAIVGLSFGIFHQPEPWELVIIALDVGVVLSYFVVKLATGEAGRAAKVANGLMVIDIFLSFIPTWVSTWVLPEGENYLPWMIWTVSYFVLAIVGASQIHKKWDERKWLVIYPLTSAVFHGAVAVIVLIFNSA